MSSIASRCSWEIAAAPAGRGSSGSPRSGSRTNWQMGILEPLKKITGPGNACGAKFMLGLVLKYVGKHLKESSSKFTYA